MKLFQLEDSDRAYAFRDAKGELFTFMNVEHMESTVEDGECEVVCLQVVEVLAKPNTYDEERARVKGLTLSELREERRVAESGSVRGLAVANELEARELDRAIATVQP